MVLAGIACLAVSGTTVLVSPAPASAYKLIGCKMPSATVKWIDSTGGGTYGTVAQQSADAWYHSDTPIYFSKVTSGANVAIKAANFGNLSGVDGLTKSSDGTGLACSGGIWSKQVGSWWNTYHTNAYSDAKKQSVMAHELGHALGLDHPSYVGPCVSIPLMAPTTSQRFDSCGIKAPRYDDEDGVNAIY